MPEKQKSREAYEKSTIPYPEAKNEFGSSSFSFLCRCAIEKPSINV